MSALNSDAYARTLSRVQALGRFGVRFGLERITAALERLGRPQERFPAVHIAGTNGKGSTAAMVESCLRAAGVHTGLFTSPHLCRFTERIRVDGEEISQADVVRLAARAQAQEGLTFFEVVTAMALCAFAERGIQLAVMETGMGGRLDATNVVRPAVCVLTSVGLDHTEVLGPDLASVATEKAGIFKPGVPVVCAPSPSPEVERVVRQRCAVLQAPLHVLGRDFDLHGGHEAVFEMGHRRLGGLSLSLAGEHQRQNAALCLAALTCLRDAGWPMEDAELRRGLAGVCWPGRMEWVDGAHLLDGAHNLHGAEALARELLATGRRFCLVLGVNTPQKPRPLVEPLLAVADQVICTRPRSPRALDPERLALEIPGSVAAPDLQTALDLARPDLPRLITGSLYLVGEARALLAGDQVDPVVTADPR